MNKNHKKIKITNVFLTTIIVFTMIISFTSVYATDWWTAAYNFASDYAGAETQVGGVKVGTLFTSFDSIINIIQVVGNIIFVVVTVILGVKYIWGGVESKASVKDSLMTLIVAAMVFYGWNSIKALIEPSSFLSSDVNNTATKIASTILYIANFLAIGGIVYIGIRYMMAGAEGKSQLKAKGVPIVLGIVMVYATITFLNLIVGSLSVVSVATQ